MRYVTQNKTPPPASLAEAFGIVFSLCLHHDYCFSMMSRPAFIASMLSGISPWWRSGRVL